MSTPTQPPEGRSESLGAEAQLLSLVSEMSLMLQHMATTLERIDRCCQEVLSAQRATHPPRKPRPLKGDPATWPTPATPPPAPPGAPTPPVTPPTRPKRTQHPQ